MYLRLILPNTEQDPDYWYFFFLPFVAAIVYGIWASVRYYYWYNIKPIEPHYKVILSRYFSYYSNLPLNLKSVFERRVALFIRSKDYYGQEGLKVTDEMRVLIAATGVQITFGFEFFQLPRFGKIFIYPKEYYSRQTNKRHKGEVYPMGRLIKLSWNNFLKGFENPDDGINLGIHEMTHAMSLENRYARNGESAFISPSAYKDWKVFALAEMDNIKKGKSTFFRSYAATNLEEFLAVSVEVFFEKTIAFSEYNPRLYQATCRILKQDPLPNKLKNKR